MIDKDKSIITQVAAKIAGDLTPKGTDTDKLLSDFTYLFESIKDIVLEACGIPLGTPSEVITSVFPGAEQMQTGGEITVVGRQHGELPQWLLEACKRDGVTRIYDNRDTLKENPKRPWFKAVDDKEKAYWAPRGK
jgi:hypothetical protein